MIGFALDGYPIIAHYKGIHGQTGDEAFGWQEVSGYEPDADYREEVIEGGANSTYAWDNYNYEGKRKGRTLDECNGRSLGKVKLASGATFDEESFFGFASSCQMYNAQISHLHQCLYKQNIDLNFQTGS